MDLPLRINIPLPSEIPRGRGRNATGRFGTGIRVRITHDERLQIERVIATLDGEMTMSSFLRWCGVQAALAIEKEVQANAHHAEQDGNRTTGGADGA